MVVRSCYSKPRFPSSPLIIRVPFFLLFGFNKGTPKNKGKRVLGNRETGFIVQHGLVDIYKSFYPIEQSRMKLCTP